MHQIICLKLLNREKRGAYQMHKCKFPDITRLTLKGISQLSVKLEACISIFSSSQLKILQNFSGFWKMPLLYSWCY